MVGLDLLEIDRLERALERRPGLAERLFTEAERAYAAAQARPAQHLAARFCAKEAVTKALGLDVLRPRDIEVVATGGAPRARACAARPPSAPPQLGVEVSRLADPHAGDGRRRGGGGAVTLPALARAGCPTPSAMRATDRWAIERGRHPGRSSSWSAPAAGWPRSSERLARRRAGRGRLRQGQQRRRRLRRRAAAARARARGRRAGRSRPSASCAATRARTPTACPGPPPSPSRRRAWRAPPSPSTRCWAPASTGEPRGPAARGDRPRCGRWRRPWWRPTCPAASTRRTGEVAGQAVRAAATATFVAAKPGLWIAPGKAHAGAVEVIDIGIPPGAPVPDPEVALLRDAPLLASLPTRRGARDEVHERARPGRGRLARPDRRPGPDGARRARARAPAT